MQRKVYTYAKENEKDVFSSPFLTAKTRITVLYFPNVSKLRNLSNGPFMQHLVFNPDEYFSKSVKIATLYPDYCHVILTAVVFHLWRGEQGSPHLGSRYPIISSSISHTCPVPSPTL
jgi:hypothetical protein